jgi:hypothetical protein
MTHEERTLAQLGSALSQLARPHGFDETLPPDVLATLHGLGLTCHEQSPRAALIAELWARKRTLSMAFQHASANHHWPPPAA